VFIVYNLANLEPLDGQSVLFQKGPQPDMYYWMYLWAYGNMVWCTWV